MASSPLPSRATLCVPGVRYSTRPLLVGAPVSWYQFDELTGEPAAPVNSSDHVGLPGATGPDGVLVGGGVVGGVVGGEVVPVPPPSVVEPDCSVWNSVGMPAVFACLETTSLASVTPPSAPTS